VHAAPTLSFLLVASFAACERASGPSPSASATETATATATADPSTAPPAPSPSSDVAHAPPLSNAKPSSGWGLPGECINPPPTAKLPEYCSHPECFGGSPPATCASILKKP
jgi:hypothetical protein